MTDIVRYLTHPEVVIDPAVPIDEWNLSEHGARRVSLLATTRVLSGTNIVFSSAETKAVDTAEPLARALGCRLEIHPQMHENDRSSTGYLPLAQFEAMADAFFANPETSASGWEPAVSAQSRICSAMEQALKMAPEGDVLFVGHGAVGTLLWCALSGRPISRQWDQPNGGGNVFTFHREDRRVLSEWEPLEAVRAYR